MSSNINHIIGPAHDVQVTITIEIAAVTSVIITRVLTKVRLHIALVVPPYSWQAPRRERQLYHYGAFFIGI